MKTELKDLGRPIGSSAINKECDHKFRELHKELSSYDIKAHFFCEKCLKIEARTVRRL